jgi:hypothetical protein
MNRRQVKVVVAAVGVTALSLLVPSIASAGPGSDGAGRAFGQHVAQHARDGMLSGEMNPGLHQGFAGFGEHHHHHGG